MNIKDLEVIYRWLAIREENGHECHKSAISFKIDAEHSALLNRLMEGKEIFSIPPPQSFSYSWYYLIENGIANPNEVWEVESSEKFVPYDAVMIDQFPWKIIKNIDEKIEKDCWIVTYPYGKIENGVQKFADGEWLVRRIGNKNLPSDQFEGANKLWEIKKIK